MSSEHKNKCLKCSEPFDAPEFFSYMLKPRSRTIHCLRCQTENYFVPNWSLAYFVFLALCVFIGFIIFACVFVMMGSYDEYTGEFSFKLWSIVIGTAIGSSAVWLLINLFTWRYRSLSLEIQYKSMSDYD